MNLYISHTQLGDYWHHSALASLSFTHKVSNLHYWDRVGTCKYDNFMQLISQSFPCCRTYHFDSQGVYQACVFQSANMYNTIRLGLDFARQVRSPTGTNLFAQARTTLNNFSTHTRTKRGCRAVYGLWSINWRIFMVP